jgi:hypothetical protein
MELFSIQTLLLAGKWLFVALIYFVLFIVVVAVRREMALRLPSGPALASTAVGRLLLHQAGNDPTARAGAVWPLKPDNSLGAAPDNDIVLADALVSGHHARLRWDGAGWWLEDLGSTNGTFVNGQRLVALTAQRIALGAHLQLGDMLLELQA